MISLNRISKYLPDKRMKGWGNLKLYRLTNIRKITKGYNNKADLSFNRGFNVLRSSNCVDIKQNTIGITFEN